MFGDRGVLWPVVLTCGHLCLATETALYVKATLCRVCPQSPTWPVKGISSMLELTPV